MKLVKDFLDNHSLYMCNVDLTDKRATAEWTSNRNVWGEHLLVGLKGDVSATAVDPIINQKIKDGIIKHFPELCDKDTEIRSQYFQWEHGSGISTHHDHLFKFVATLYLNKEWKDDYGGIFMWRDANNQLHAQCPEYNAIIMDTDTSPHLVTPVTYASPESRLTIQILAIK